MQNAQLKYAHTNSTVSFPTTKIKIFDLLPPGNKGQALNLVC